MPHVCDSEVGHYWFVACSVPSHYLDHHWCIVNWTLGEKTNEKFENALYKINTLFTGLYGITSDTDAMILSIWYWKYGDTADTVITYCLHGDTAEIMMLIAVTSACLRLFQFHDLAYSAGGLDRVNSLLWATIRPASDRCRQHQGYADPFLSPYAMLYSGWTNGKLVFLYNGNCHINETWSAKWIRPWGPFLQNVE